MCGNRNMSDPNKSHCLLKGQWLLLHLEKRVWDREKKKRKSKFDRACQKKTTVVYFIDMSLKIDKNLSAAGSGRAYGN